MIRKAKRIRIMIVVGALTVVVAALAFQSITFATNNNALEASLAKLNPQEHDRVQALVEIVTRGMLRNEESGVVYYQDAARTGKGNRIHLLWLLCPEGTKAEALRRTTNRPEAGDMALVAHVDLGFHTFRSKYGLTLAKLFKDRGLEGLRGTCYAWDGEVRAWRLAGEVANADVLSLLTEVEKQDIRRGTYNKVVAAHDEE